MSNQDLLSLSDAPKQYNVPLDALAHELMARAVGAGEVR